MIKRVVDMEATLKPPSYVELFKGTDLRRTIIVALVFASQNFTGNLIANQAVFFFERESLLPL
jgi:SP family general alpha glucoside:H+ symporter-like MFS transporter